MLTFKEAYDQGNAGAGDIGVFKQVHSTAKDDIEAHDQLGPKTRALISQKMPLKFSSAKTLEMIKQMRMDPVQHDDLIARQLSHAVDMAHKAMRDNQNLNTQSL